MLNQYYVRNARWRVFNFENAFRCFFFLIQHRFALTNNYADLIDFASNKLDEHIINQYLDSCPKNAPYKSNTSVESLLDAMNIFFEMKNLDDIKDAQILTIYGDEVENLSYRETFAIFLTYFSETMECLKTKFFGILKIEKKNTADIMDSMKKFFAAKGINVEKILLSVLDGINTMSRRKNGLQWWIEDESPHKIYLNCRNHRLALCLPHLMKDKEFVPLLATYDNFFLGVWKTFRHSPKKMYHISSIQEIYGKKLLKIFKAVKTRWLTHGQASKWVLDRFEEILTTLDSICANRFELELRCYMTNWMEHVTIFTLRLMTNIY